MVFIPISKIGKFYASRCFAILHKVATFASYFLIEFSCNSPEHVSEITNNAGPNYGNYYKYVSIFIFYNYRIRM